MKEFKDLGDTELHSIIMEGTDKIKQAAIDADIAGTASDVEQKGLDRASRETIAGINASGRGSTQQSKTLEQRYEDMAEKITISEGGSFQENLSRVKGITLLDKHLYNPE